MLSLVFRNRATPSVHKYMVPLTFLKFWLFVLFKKIMSSYLFCCDLFLSHKSVCAWFKVLHFWMNILNKKNGQFFEKNNGVIYLWMEIVLLSRDLWVGSRDQLLRCLKGYLQKKIVELSLREKTSLIRNSSSNRRLTSHCTNSLSVLSIRRCTSVFTSVFINRLYL